MIAHNLAVALRRVPQEPAIAAIKIAVLALGLACFLAVAAVVGYWNSAEQAYAKADRTFVMTSRVELSDGSDSGVQPRFLLQLEEELKAEFPEFENVALARAGGETSVVAGSHSLLLQAAYAQASFLDIFDMPFRAGDPRTALGAPNSVVLTETAAERLFGEEPALGRTLRFSGVADVTVTGVLDALPEPSHIGSTPSSILRFDVLASWDVAEAVLRANPGASGDAIAYVVLPAGSSLTPSALAPRMAQAFDIVPAGERHLVTWTFGLTPVGALMTTRLDSALFSGVGVGLTFSTLLMGLGVLALAVACVNTVNLAIAQGLPRTKEVGMRKVIGAGAAQIAAQHLLEAAVLTIAACALALGLVALAAPALRAAAGVDIGFVLPTPRFWAIAFLAAALTALVSGAYPAMALSRVPPRRALHAGDAEGSGLLPAILVGAQFGVASFLLTVIIVMQQQSVDLRRSGLSDGADPLMVITNASGFTGVASATLQEELRLLPQVSAVGGMARQPWSEDIGTGTFLTSPADADSLLTTATIGVDYDFFSAANVPLLAGRGFDRTRADRSIMARIDQENPASLVIDENFARELGYATPEAALDQLVYWPAAGSFQPVRVIGVAADRPMSFMSIGATSSAYYLATEPRQILVRFKNGDAKEAIDAIRDVWRSLAPDAPFVYAFEDQLFTQGYAVFGGVSGALAGLGGLALFNCAVGLVGMAGLMTARRRREVGVRKTLGATTGGVLGLLLWDVSRPVLIANLLAGPAAYLAAQVYLSIFIHRVPLTPAPFALSLLVTLLVAWAAVIGEVLKAASVRPAEVLRHA